MMGRCQGDDKCREVTKLTGNCGGIGLGCYLEFIAKYGPWVDPPKLLVHRLGLQRRSEWKITVGKIMFAGQIQGFSFEGYIDGKNDRHLDDCLRYCIVAGKKALEDEHDT
ncbi:hypothetical protein K1719_027658 [Acacia pycnantha]|nr:hypothetical protein K1719_027658 [Acacia pycnantha]